MRSLVRSATYVTLVILILTLPSCSSSNNPTTPTQPDEPSQAQIITGAVATSVDASPAAGFTYRVTVAISIGETAGVGANINSMRFQFFTGASTPDETRQLGASEIIAQTGSNRIEGNASRDLAIRVDFDTAGVVLIAAKVNERQAAPTEGDCLVLWSS